jgi:hypothetical protein
MVAMWGTGEYQHAMNPDMPWNEEIRASWARQERLAASQGRDLVIGSGLEFEDRGAHELKGVPGEWRLFAVASA